MESLVIANIKQRKMRTAISILGVALGVILISMVSGLAHGMLGSRARREGNINAEIIFRRSGDLTTSRLDLPVAYVPKLKQIEGVAGATPVAQYVKSGTTGIGFELIEGIEFKTYDQINPLNVIQGRGLSDTGYEVIVDTVYVAEHHQIKLGDKIPDLFGHDFTVVGIYTIERGARIKMPLSTLQQLLGSADHCSLIYVKVDKQYADHPEIAAKAIDKELPQNQLILTKDIPSLYAHSLPQLDTFLDVVVGLSAVISTLVILLAMYTTITERTREIGILKSLGASKQFIISAIEREALLISAIGVVVGFILAFAASFVVARKTTLVIDMTGQPMWLVYSAAIGLLGGLVGALYPALRAARQDAVKALSYE